MPDSIILSLTSKPPKESHSNFLAKGLNIPYVPIEIDFKNRRFKIHQYKYVQGSFEEESDKIINLFKGVEGATRTFKML